MRTTGDALVALAANDDAARAGDAGAPVCLCRGRCALAIRRTTRGAVAAREILARIDADPLRFIESMGGSRERPWTTLPDGSQVKRIPGFNRWTWDDDPEAPFCGSISVRWQPGNRGAATSCARPCLFT